MKPSERILAYCAVFLTFLALTIWLKFFQLRPHPSPPPEPLPVSRRTDHNIEPSFTTTHPNATAGTRTPPAAGQSVTEPIVKPPLPVVSDRKSLVSPPVSTTSAHGHTNISSAVGSLEAAVIHGTVFFKGTPPTRKKIKTDADPHCVGESLLGEEVIVNANGTLRNVFVYLAGGLEGMTFETPNEPVTLDQRGCAYVPHVFGMHAKQLLLIRNSDDTTHNIHAMPNDPGNKEFNNGQPAGSADLKKTFASPEVMVSVRCDVHPWMHAYVGVLDHPFFSVTGTDGSFTLAPLPAGTYTVAIWHERFGSATQDVKVGEREVKEISFVFEEQ